LKKNDELTIPDHYINRELSWLEFNRRVYEEAHDKTNPLLERIKFLAIFSSNLDEFFMVRVSGLKRQIAAGIKKTCPSGLTPQEQLERIYERLHPMVIDEYVCFNDMIGYLSKNYQIHFMKPHQLSDEQRSFLDDYYEKEIFPVLTPLAIDACHPFPFLLSASLNLFFSFQKNQDEIINAIVQVPDVLPRLVRISDKQGHYVFLYLEDIIVHYSHILYPDFKLIEAFTFRITRDSDLAIHEDESYDLLKDIETELRNRRRGEAVRLEIDKRVSASALAILIKELDIDDNDVFKINGPLNLKDFMNFYNQIDISELKFSLMPPQPLPGVPDDGDLFAYIKERDILLHHPYHTFSYVINFIEKAALDPDVLAIKMTLYRVSGNSPIVKALIAAAEAGKQVTALVELKARFDEERNIEWAKKLEKSGVHVIYGLLGLKTHSKVALVIRREPEGIKRYIHMSTGNYNDATARVYTDLGIMTADEDFGADISALYNVLTGFSNPPQWLKISVAPTGLRKKVISLIQREAKRSTKNQPGRIIAKMNSLVDEEVIYNLYRASQAGVSIDLIIRGICCLRPGAPRISKNIRVISIVDRFLEHSRIFYFRNGGEEELYLSSADWMPRNLDRRVELFFPVENPEVKKEVMKALDLALKDTIKARELQLDGSYVNVNSHKKKPLKSQDKLYESAVEAVKRKEKMEKTAFIPLKPNEDRE
jgi:polyphosphate kinase